MYTYICGTVRTPLVLLNTARWQQSRVHGSCLQSRLHLLLEPRNLHSDDNAGTVLHCACSTYVNNRTECTLKFSTKISGFRKDMLYTDRHPLSAHARASFRLFRCQASIISGGICCNVLMFVDDPDELYLTILRYILKVHIIVAKKET